MKKTNILYFAVLLLSFGLFTACEEEQDVVTQYASEGGLIEQRSKLSNLIVGSNDTYPINFVVFQDAEVKTTQVDVYKTFNAFKRDAEGELVLDEDENPIPLTSNRVLLETVDIDEAAGTELYTIEVDFDELRQGLQIEGNDLPMTDAELNIGDNWVLEFVSTTSDGRTVINNSGNSAKISVATRFAGTYAITDAEYYRIGVLTYTESSYPDEFLIESVDATTYKIQEYFGPFEGNELYFTIDPVTLEINYPAEINGVAQTGNDQPLITCKTDPNNMTNVPCGPETNIAIVQENGKDVLVMSFGYLTAGSGPREFYQVLEKKID